MSTVYIRFGAHRSDTLQRSALLERLIARASTSVRVANWRADALQAWAPGALVMPPIAAAVLMDVPSAPGAVWACIATPVHTSAGMNSVMMAQDGVLRLEASEATALAADFNRVFGDAGARLRIGRDGVLLCVFDETLEVETHDPEDVAGCDLFGFQPTGTDGPRLRRLMSEIEMWLFDHEVNRSRETTSRPAITGLWLWGGGPVGPALPRVHGWVAGRDPFFSAFGSESHLPRSASPGVLVCTEQPGSPGWRNVEQDWLEPLVHRLRWGGLERLDLSAAGRRFSLKPAANWKFWRRTQPWWTSFGVEGRSDDRE